MPIEQISLYYKDGSSDKVYHAQIEIADGGYLVNFQYGRRGSTPTAGTKTKAPVSMEKAKTAFDSLVKEKKSKGYSEGESGAIFQSQTLEERFTGIVPQLLCAVAEEELEELFRNPDWIMQEKHDGKRILIKKQGNEVTAINRKGLVVLIPQVVVDKVQECAVDMLLDGEMIGERYYIFDILEVGGQDIRQTPYEDRLAALEKLDSLKTWVTPTYKTEKNKRKAFAQVKERRGEGLVFKKLDSFYVPGRPASGGNQLKFKFVESATVIVVSNHATKRSIGVAVYNEAGEEVKIGNVTISANFTIPPVGSIVEVLYLYCYEGGSLYQPVYKGVRDDQAEVDCVLRQLKYKAVLAEEDE